jgi:hypothetical protein
MYKITIQQMFTFAWYTKRSKRYSFSEISDTERAALLDVILSSDANTIAQTVLQTPSVYKCIKIEYL